MSSSSRQEIEASLAAQKAKVDAEKAKLDADLMAIRLEEKRAALENLQIALEGLSYDAEFIQKTLNSSGSLIDQQLRHGASKAVFLDRTLSKIEGLRSLCQKIITYRDTSPIAGSIPPDLENDFNAIHQATVKDNVTYLRALINDFTSNLDNTSIPIQETSDRLQIMQNFVSNPSNLDNISALATATDKLGKEKRTLAREQFWSGLQVMTGIAVVIAAVALFAVGLATLPYDFGMLAAGVAIPLAYAGFAIAFRGHEDIQKFKHKSQAPVLQLHDNMKLFASPKQPSADSKLDAKPTPTQSPKNTKS